MKLLYFILYIIFLQRPQFQLAIVDITRLVNPRGCKILKSKFIKCDSTPDTGWKCDRGEPICMEIWSTEQTSHSAVNATEVSFDGIIRDARKTRFMFVCSALYWMWRGTFYRLFGFCALMYGWVYGGCMVGLGKYVVSIMC